MRYTNRLLLYYYYSNSPNVISDALERADLFVIGEQEVEVERQRGDEIDDVDRCPYERQLARTDDEPDKNLECKPRVADTLDVEEGVVRVGAPLVEHPRLRTAVGRRLYGRRRHDATGEPCERDVLDRRNAHARMRLEAERQD